MTAPLLSRCDGTTARREMTSSHNNPIRVGIIGLNPGIHWGATAHVPALASLPDDYELVGVANTSLASAERAAKAFGLKHAFPNA